MRYIFICIALLILGLYILSNFLWYASTSEQKSDALKTVFPTRSSLPVFSYPIAQGDTRITKKIFGMFVSPQHSPIHPERFTGYHTGIDFETISQEQNTDVIITAACSGLLLMKKWAIGYGGVMVQSCMLNGQPVTVIYGHLRFSSITLAVGQSFSSGDTIGILGGAYSTETDGERKHLHFGIHKGNTIDIHGYVKSSPELSGWINPLDYLK